MDDKGKERIDRQYFDPEDPTFVDTEGQVLHRADGTKVDLRNVEKIKPLTEQEIFDVGRTLAPLTRDLPRLRSEIEKRAGARGPKQRFQFEYDCPIPQDAALSDDRISMAINTGVVILLLHSENQPENLFDLVGRHGYQLVPKVEFPDNSSCTVTVFVKPNPKGN